MDAIRIYQVLDKVRISGTETFSKIIKDAYEVISTKVYDPLAHRLREFDADYETFFQQLELAELGLQRHVKEVLKPIPTVDSRLLVLARYEKLQLDCLCLDRRYLDVAVLMEREIENLKDSYNADRADPIVPWCVPSPVGRMMWAHCLLRKLDEPVKVLRTKRCVVEHPKAQLCIKYYNYLAGVLIHYELLHHKAWFDYVEQVRNKLELPVLDRDRQQRLHTNLDPYVLQVIKETETVLKMEYGEWTNWTL
jgi:dynein heavy chain, axonemal